MSDYPISVDYLPENYIVDLLLQLGYPRILQLCSTSYRYSRICNKPYLWNLLLQIDYNYIVHNHPVSNPKATFITIYNVIKTKRPSDKDLLKLNNHSLKSDNLDLYKLLHKYFRSNIETHWLTLFQYSGELMNQLDISNLITATSRGSFDIAHYIFQNIDLHLTNYTSISVISSLYRGYNKSNIVKAKSLLNLLLKDSRFSKPLLLRLTAYVGDTLFAEIIKLDIITSEDINDALTRAVTGNQKYITQLLLQDYRLTSSGIIDAISSIIGEGQDNYRMMDLLLYNDTYSHKDLILIISQSRQSSDLLLNTLKILIEFIDRETLNQSAANLLENCHQVIFNYLYNNYDIDLTFDHSLIIRKSSYRCFDYITSKLISPDNLETILLDIVNYTVTSDKLSLIKHIFNNLSISNGIIEKALLSSCNSDYVDQEDIFVFLYNIIDSSSINMLYDCLTRAVEKNLLSIINAIVVDIDPIDTRPLFNIALDNGNILAAYMILSINDTDPCDEINDPRILDILNNQINQIGQINQIKPKDDLCESLNELIWDKLFKFLNDELYKLDPGKDITDKWIKKYYRYITIDNINDMYNNFDPY